MARKIRKIKRVVVVEGRYQNSSLNDTIDWLVMTREKIPEPFRAEAVFELEAESHYDMIAKIYYRRPETDQEVMERELVEAVKKIAKEQEAERNTYDRRKAKFEK